jgi:iron(III) transport system substrate-binding protein
VLRLFNSVARVFAVNTSIVKSDDMRTVRDLLLGPKFKGKIATHDPTVTGVGSNIAAQFYVQLGEDFVRQLYVDQKPVISRDERQLTDWLLHGTYPIVFGEDDAQVYAMKKEGLPVDEVYSLPGLAPSLLGGNGMLAVFDHAPHPNATKLFVNWLASREGLEIFARAVQWSPTRNDIDEKNFVPVENIPVPGVDYFDAYDWEFSVNTKTKVRLWLKDLLGR